MIKAIAQRLANAGKPFKMIMTDCIRKLLTMLNITACVSTRKYCTWDACQMGIAVGVSPDHGPDAMTGGRPIPAKGFKPEASANSITKTTA